MTQEARETVMDVLYLVEYKHKGCRKWRQEDYPFGYLTPERALKDGLRYGDKSTKFRVVSYERTNIVIDENGIKCAGVLDG